MGEPGQLRDRAVSGAALPQSPAELKQLSAFPAEIEGLRSTSVAAARVSGWWLVDAVICEFE